MSLVLFNVFIDRIMVQLGARGGPGQEPLDLILLILLFADDVVLLASSNQYPQHALGQLESIVLSLRPLQGGRELLPQVEEFTFLGIFSLVREEACDRQVDRLLGCCHCLLWRLGAEPKRKTLNLPVSLCTLSHDRTRSQQAAKKQFPLQGGSLRNRMGGTLYWTPPL